MEQYQSCRPRTPKKVRSRRRTFSVDEIPTRDTSFDASRKSPRYPHQNDTKVTPCHLECCNPTQCYPDPRRRFAELTTRSFHPSKHIRGRSEGSKVLDHVDVELGQSGSYHDDDCPIADQTSSNRIRRSPTRNNSAKMTNTPDTSIELQGSNNFRDIYRLWKKGDLCDVIIHAGGERFYAHRLVVAAICENFANDSKGIQNHAVIEYTIPNVSAAVMKEVISYFYTSAIDIAQENVGELIGVSQILGIRKISEACGLFLSTVNAGNAIFNMQLARKYRLTDAEKTISNFMSSNFSSIVSTEAFLECSFRRVYDLISYDLLIERDPLKTFHACKKWIDYNRTDRLSHAASLMKLVSFVDIHPNTIASQIEHVRFMVDIPECRSLLYNAFRDHAIGGQGASRSTSRLSCNSRRGEIPEHDDDPDSPWPKPQIRVHSDGFPLQDSHSGRSPHTKLRASRENLATYSDFADGKTSTASETEESI